VWINRDKLAIAQNNAQRIKECEQCNATPKSIINSLKLPKIEDEQEQMLGISGPQEARFQALKFNCEELDQKP
jgi:Zn ribbon nucleic-acid-binding protein